MIHNFTKLLKTGVASFIAVAFSFVGFSYLGDSAVHANAEKQQLHTYGRVLPVHSVILDRGGSIKEVYSNTTGAATTVYYNQTISPKNIISPDQHTKRAYEEIIDNNQPKVGRLYAKPNEITFTHVLHMLANSALSRNYE